jgi:hypothetical protein
MDMAALALFDLGFETGRRTRRTRRLEINSAGATLVMDGGYPASCPNSGTIRAPLQYRGS